MNDPSESLRLLRSLEEGTEWESDGSLLAANDPKHNDEDDDGGVAVLPSGPHLHPIDGGAEVDDSMDRSANPDEILSTAAAMAINGDVEDLLVIVNQPNGNQILMCTLDRNDHIIGMLTVATLNWHSSQIAASNFYENDEEV